MIVCGFWGGNARWYHSIDHPGPEVLYFFLYLCICQVTTWCDCVFVSVCGCIFSSLWICIGITCNVSIFQTTLGRRLCNCICICGYLFIPVFLYIVVLVKKSGGTLVQTTLGRRLCICICGYLFSPVFLYLLVFFGEKVRWHPGADHIGPEVTPRWQHALDANADPVRGEDCAAFSSLFTFTSLHDEGRVQGRSLKNNEIIFWKWSQVTNLLGVAYLF